MQDLLSILVVHFECVLVHGGGAVRIAEFTQA